MAASSSSSAQSKPTVGILSIGDMGLGVARLLRHHEYQVYTVGAGRSQHTLDRIEAAQITALPCDEALVAESDIILSIVPPRDAIATAKRIHEACRNQDAITQRMERKGTEALHQATSVTYIDLNAISPRTTRSIATLFNTAEPPPLSPRRLSLARSFSFRKADAPPSPPPLDPITVNYLDGGIIGGPPAANKDGTWKKPSIIVSGPRATALLTDPLIALLNVKLLGDEIGKASTLKSCFASLTKGLTALTILSYTTAQTSGVLPELQAHLKEFTPSTLTHIERSVTGMAPKAYRWVDEMRQIGETFRDEGGFGHGIGGDGVFEGIAEIYKLVADETVLGQERVEKRKRGTDARDVAECVRQGIAKKKRKGSSDERLELTWRGSWS